MLPKINYQEVAEKRPKYSIIMPCLNESTLIGKCIDFAQGFVERNNLIGEIIVVDNGSPDGSRKVAESRNIYLIEEKNTGYGNACRKGLRVAKGDILILIDADDIYQINDVIGLLEALEKGYDLINLHI
jgi:glycosyltransferase involved in cell wall biosynthesis